MKNRKIVTFGAALLGAIAVFGSAAPSFAASHNNRTRSEVWKARREVRKERRDYRNADGSDSRRDAKHDLQRAQNNLRQQKKELRHDRRQNNNGNNWNISKAWRYGNSNRYSFNRYGYNRYGFNRAHHYNARFDQRR